MPNKQDLRKYYREKRLAINSRQRQSRRIYQRLSAITLKKLKIAYYLPLNGEVDLRPLKNFFRAQNCQLLLPKIKGKKMIFVSDQKPYQKAKKLPFFEPKWAFEKTPDIILVPGLAFDQKGYRLGYGGGYYDRYLASHQQVTTIAIGYHEQLATPLPKAHFDIRLTYLNLGKRLRLSHFQAKTKIKLV